MQVPFGSAQGRLFDSLRSLRTTPSKNMQKNKQK
jgi:hypothetical protein